MEITPQDLTLLSMPEGFYKRLEDYLESNSFAVHYARDASGREIRLHTHPYYEIILFCEGQVQYLLDNSRYGLQRGDLLLIPPGVAHAPVFWGQKTMPYERFLIALKTSVVEELNRFCPEIANIQSRAFVLRAAGTQWDSLAEMVRESYLESCQKRPGWGGIVYANSVRLLVGLARAENMIAPPVMEQRETLDDILLYIGKNYRKNLSVTETAHKFHISERTLNQLFRDKMGVGFHAYLIQRRLSAAESLIMSGYAFEEAATEVGFTEYTTFFRAFKANHNASPTEYFRKPAENSKENSVKAE